MITFIIQAALLIFCVFGFLYVLYTEDYENKTKKALALAILFWLVWSATLIWMFN